MEQDNPVRIRVVGPDSCRKSMMEGLLEQMDPCMRELVLAAKKREIALETLILDRCAQRKSFALGIPTLAVAVRHHQLPPDQPDEIFVGERSDVLRALHKAKCDAAAEAQVPPLADIISRAVQRGGASCRFPNMAQFITAPNLDRRRWCSSYFSVPLRDEYWLPKIFGRVAVAVSPRCSLAASGECSMEDGAAHCLGYANHRHWGWLPWLHFSTRRNGYIAAEVGGTQYALRPLVRNKQQSGVREGTHSISARLAHCLDALNCASLRYECAQRVSHVPSVLLAPAVEANTRPQNVVLISSPNQPPDECGLTWNSALARTTHTRRAVVETNLKFHSSCIQGGRLRAYAEAASRMPLYRATAATVRAATGSAWCWGECARGSFSAIERESMHWGDDGRDGTRGWHWIAPARAAASSWFAAASAEWSFPVRRFLEGFLYVDLMALLPKPLPTAPPSQMLPTMASSVGWGLAPRSGCAKATRLDSLGTVRMEISFNWQLPYCSALFAPTDLAVWQPWRCGIVWSSA